MADKQTMPKGQRPLTPEQLAMFNRIDDIAETCRDLFHILDTSCLKHNGFDPDPEWVNIARADLQKGFMSARRAIGRPDKF